MGLIGDIGDALGITSAWEERNANVNKDIQKELNQQQAELNSALSRQNSQQTIEENKKKLEQELFNSQTLSSQNFTQSSQLSAQESAQTINENKQKLLQEYNNSLALQRQAQAFQTEYDSTAYQRKIADMEQAGINPTLAFGGVSNNSAQSSNSPTPQSSNGVQLPHNDNKVSNARQRNTTIKQGLNSAFKTSFLTSAVKHIKNLSGKLAKAEMWNNGKWTKKVILRDKNGKPIYNKKTGQVYYKIQKKSLEQEIGSYLKKVFHVVRN